MPPRTLLIVFAFLLVGCGRPIVGADTDATGSPPTDDAAVDAAPVDAQPTDAPDASSTDGATDRREAGDAGGDVKLDGAALDAHAG